MATDDITTIIPPPPEPMSIGYIIESLIQAEVEERDSEIFEQLYLEQIYSEKKEKQNES